MTQTSPSLQYEPMYAALRELGLTENEQRFYVTSINTGPATIAHLAKLLGLPRPNLYKIIDGLQAKGLVSKTMRESKSRKFMVDAPSTISSLLKEKRDYQAQVDHAFLEKLPSFLSQFQQGNGPIKTTTLVGHHDFVRVFNQMFEEEKEVLYYFGSVKDLEKTVSQPLIKKNVEQRVRRQVRTKALLPASDQSYLTEQEHKEQLRDVRYLPNNHQFVSSFHVFANKIILWQPKTPMAVLIEDVYLANMFVHVFQLIWDASD